MSSKKTSKTDQVTNSTSQKSVYDPAKAGLHGSLGMMTNWMKDPRSLQIYDKDRVAGLSDYTKQGMAGLVNNAGYGQAGDYYSKVLAGDYLNAGNPHLDGLQQSIQRSVMPGVNATFGRSGMTGATNHQYHLPKALGDAMAPHMFANYENERNRQAMAANALPGLYSQQANDALRAGGIQDQHNQNVINADIYAFNAARDRPMNVANAGFANFLNAGNVFGQNTTSGTTKGTTTTKGDPFSTIVGAGMMGLGAMSGMPGMMSGAGGAGGMQSMFGAPMQAASQSAMMAAPMTTLQNYNYNPPLFPAQVPQQYGGNASYGYGGGL